MQSAMDYFNLQPSQVKGRANIGTAMHKRYLYTMLSSVYDFTLPEEWPVNFFRFFLFHFGSIGVIYTKKFGWMALPYGVSEVDAYFQPRKLIFSNHMFDSEKTGIIGVNSGIIHIMDDFYGIDDLITDYAEKLANLDKTFNISLMNSNVAVALEAENPKKADELKEAYTKATTGQPFVALNKKLLEGEGFKPLFSNPKNFYLCNNLLEDRRNLISQFLTEIGIPNTPYEKKAQMSTQEINRNGGETRSIASVIMENLKKDMEKINRISGLELSVTWREGVSEIADNTERILPVQQRTDV